MKKVFLFVAAAMVLASCAKNENELVSVNLGVSTDVNAGSKVLWDVASGNTIGVKFQVGEKMDVFEYGIDGYQTFTCRDLDPVQSGNFIGVWHGNNTGNWAAVYPGNGLNSVTMSANYANVYHLNIPNSQTTRSRAVNVEEFNIDVVSPDSSANVMVGSTKDHTTRSSFLAPVCAYIHFATDANVNQVTVAATSVAFGSHAGTMAGSANLSTSSTSEDAFWTSWVNFLPFYSINNLSVVTTNNSITVTGHEVTRNGVSLNEYVVCVFPGTYTGLTFSFGTHVKRVNGVKTLEPVNLYKLGNISNVPDAPTSK